MLRPTCLGLWLSALFVFKKWIWMSLGTFSIISCLLHDSLSGDFETPCVTKCCPARQVGNYEKQSLLVLKGIVTNPQLMLILIKYLSSKQVLDVKSSRWTIHHLPQEVVPRVNNLLQNTSTSWLPPKCPVIGKNVIANLLNSMQWSLD